MKKIRMSDLRYANFWTGWRRWVIWSTCISAILLLGAFRSATDAEFVLASLALLPVLVVAWLGGKSNGLFMATLAAAMWAFGDISSHRQHSALWIPWANGATHLMTYSLLAVIAAQVRLQFQRAHEHATLDALTGLRNRRAIFEAGGSEAERCKRYERPFTVIFLDLDNFKQLNDTKGHHAGDAALQATANALRNFTQK